MRGQPCLLSFNEPIGGEGENERFTVIGVLMSRKIKKCA
ncbi:hypothetical protein ECEPECC34262_2446 [Escherichia coli EPEC C342-62]|nr:hypothetical protein ECEPECC34262_2446 [Escherichia coli EPEC C342-62]